MTKITLPSGVGISLQIDGKEDGPWLVLSNSVATTHRMWDPQMEMLTRKYRVLRYDARGHGGSDAPLPPYSFDDLVADAVGLMDHFEMRNPSFMGLSLGGMTGLGLALSYPGRLAKLVCCDARADTTPAFIQDWDDRVNLVREKGLVAILQNTIARWLSADFRANNSATVAAIESMILSTSIAGFEGCAAALKELDYLPFLERIAVPTLFVVGSEDRGASPGVMRAMANCVGGARLEIVEGSAHLSNLDNPAGFAEAVAEFLQLG
ncbi:MAG: alpha/beta fold hydrolase [Xanthobacteraceae bacterium]|nr:alpha/beta fold hydrolase [Xanthobacteraceae bacterium]